MGSFDFSSMEEPVKWTTQQTTFFGKPLTLNVTREGAVIQSGLVTVIACSRLTFRGEIDGLKICMKDTSVYPTSNVNDVWFELEGSEFTCTVQMASFSTMLETAFDEWQKANSYALEMQHKLTANLETERDLLEWLHN